MIVPRDKKPDQLSKASNIKEGVDHTEIFAPALKLNTIRAGLSIVATEELYLGQLDVKTAFLHRDLEEKIYLHQLNV